MWVRLNLRGCQIFFYGVMGIVFSLVLLVIIVEYIV